MAQSSKRGCDVHGGGTGLNTEGDGGKKDENWEADTASTARNRQTTRGREWKDGAENPERDPAFHTWGAGKKGKRQKGEQKKRGGGIKGGGR